MKAQRDVVEASRKEEEALASLAFVACLEIFVIQTFRKVSPDKGAPAHKKYQIDF
jgi:hypothetical protein